LPRHVDHQERREAISLSGWKVVQERGLDGLAMRAVAAADCTTGMVTHYFRDKRELLAHARSVMVEAVVWSQFLLTTQTDADLLREHQAGHASWVSQVASALVKGPSAAGS
jgi:TetR/AcrR family transcriptional repressor of bet genes